MDKTSTTQWVGTWGSSQYSIEASHEEAPSLGNSTFRQVVRLSTGGERFRFTFSNEYGQTPMTIQSIHIAKPTKNGCSDIETSTDTVVTFSGGSEGVTIPPNGKVTSDAILYPAEALEKIAVSTYFGDVPETLTHHAGSRSNSFLQKGNAVSNETMGTSTFVRWYSLSNVDVLSPPTNRAIVCFGDSITDGYGTEATYLGKKPDSYLRWTDVVAEKLQASPTTRHLSVINMGIGGNAIFGGQGPAAKDRFDRDVLRQSGVGYLVVLIGVNDTGNAKDTDTTLASRMIAEYEKMFKKAREHRIKVFIGTITPTFGNEDYYSPHKEACRQEVNAWLRGLHGEGKVDGFFDTDELLRQPDSNPPEIVKELTVDNLHPSIAGYRKIGELIHDTLLRHL